MGPLGHSLSALAAVVAAPVGAAALLVRPGLRRGLAERLGGSPGFVDGPLWIHGASVGEIQASFSLLELLEARGDEVLASTMTSTGSEVLARLRPKVRRCLAPIDHPWCVERALRRVNPRLLALVESELWPSWIAAADRRGIPVCVISGRISERSFRRYHRLGGLLRPTLQRLATVGARTPEDAQRFLSLGVPEDRVEVTGDLKLEPPSEPPRIAEDLESILSGIPVFVAGSTHPGEEESALSALDQAGTSGLDVACVLAPRRPERFSEVGKALSRQGRPWRRRSESNATPLGPGEVLLLDSLGELGAVYKHAALAFVGGSLANVGGHNPIEPVFWGRPVVFGPHTQQASANADLLLGCTAAQRVEDTNALGKALVEALRDPVEAGRRGAAGRRMLESHRGSARRSLTLLDRALEARSVRS